MEDIVKEFRSTDMLKRDDRVKATRPDESLVFYEEATVTEAREFYSKVHFDADPQTKCHRINGFKGYGIIAIKPEQPTKDRQKKVLCDVLEILGQIKGHRYHDTEARANALALIMDCKQPMFRIRDLLYDDPAKTLRNWDRMKAPTTTVDQTPQLGSGPLSGDERRRLPSLGPQVQEHMEPPAGFPIGLGTVAVLMLVAFLIYRCVLRHSTSSRRRRRDSALDLEAGLLREDGILQVD